MRKFAILLTSLLIIASLALILAVVGILPFPEKYQDQVQIMPLFSSKRHKTTEHEAPARSELSIENPHGNVLIRGGDVSEVLITVKNEVRSSNPRQAKNLLEDTKVKIETTNQSNKILVESPKLNTGENVRADLEIIVPLDTNLNLQIGIGNVEVADTRGNLKIYTQIGEIKIANFTGDAYLEADLGNITIINSRFVKELIATLHLGDLSIDGILATRNEIENYLGDINLLFLENDSYVLEGTIGIGQIEFLVPFNGQQTEERFRGVIGSGTQRGTIILNAKLGSVKIKNLIDRSDN